MNYLATSLIVVISLMANVSAGPMHQPAAADLVYVLAQAPPEDPPPPPKPEPTVYLSTAVVTPPEEPPPPPTPSPPPKPEVGRVPIAAAPLPPMPPEQPPLPGKKESNSSEVKKGIPSGTKMPPQDPPPQPETTKRKPSNAAVPGALKSQTKAAADLKKSSKGKSSGMVIEDPPIAPGPQQGPLGPAPATPGKFKNYEGGFSSGAGK